MRYSAKIQAITHVRQDRRNERMKSVVRMPGLQPGASHPILEPGVRAVAVDRVKQLLRSGHASPFEREGDCRHGLRSALCLAGYRWSLSDIEAAKLIESALSEMNVRRPSWEEGQREHTIPREMCGWCAGQIPDELLFGGHSHGYCSSECARSAMVHRQLQHHDDSAAGYFAAKDTMQRMLQPARRCKECDKRFRPTRSDGIYCSPACSAAASSKAMQIHQPRPCDCCHKPFTPREADERFCGQGCYHAWRRQHVKMAECTYCGTAFPAKTFGAALFCNAECRRQAWNERHGRFPNKLRPHVFDHFFSMPINEAPRLLTPERFDELLALAA